MYHFVKAHRVALEALFVAALMVAGLDVSWANAAMQNQLPAPSSYNWMAGGGG